MGKGSGAARFCRVMAGLCLGIVILAPLALLMFWLDFGHVGASLVQQLGLEGEATVTPEAEFLAAIITFLRLSIGLFGILRLRAAFCEGAAGHYFSEDSVTAFRQFAGAWLAYVISGPIEQTLLVVALSLGNPPGERIFSFGVSVSFLRAVVFGLLFLAAAHMFRLGQRLLPDNVDGR